MKSHLTVDDGLKHLSTMSADPLLRNGWVFRCAEEMEQRIGALPRDVLESFSALELDTYALHSGLMRKRRIARFAIEETSSTVVQLPHRPFLQAHRDNRLFGGLPRAFAPMEKAISSSFFLHELLIEDLRFLNKAIDKGEVWEAIVHQIRVFVSHGKSALPAPEGRHRDGHDYLTVHLVDRNNVTGGNNLVFDGSSEKKPVFSCTLLNPLDTIVIDDARMTHDVSALRAIDSKKPAWRSMLLVDYNRKTRFEVFS